jgi:hypothetical protein
MDELKKAYWAGFIDGEGSIKIIRRKPSLVRREKNYTYRPCLSISNTDRGIIEQLKEDFNCGTIWRKKPYRENHKQAYGWYVWNRKCLAIMEILLPYLIIKRKQAELVVEFYQNCDMRQRGNQGTPQHIVDLREEYRLRFMALNKRGV